MKNPVAKSLRSPHLRQQVKPVRKAGPPDPYEQLELFPLEPERSPWFTEDVDD